MIVITNQLQAIDDTNYVLMFVYYESIKRELKKRLILLFIMNR